MKIQAIIVALLALGIGFAAGNYLSPTWSHSEVAEQAAASSTSTTASGTGADVSGSAHPAAHNVATQPVATLDSLMHDKDGGLYSYARTKSLLAYVDSLSPSEIGDTLQKVDKMPNNLAKFQFRYYLVMRWSDADPQGALAWSQ
jgi:hypothetical protein